MPVACELYLLCRRTSDDLKVFSTVFLHKKGVQSPEELLDVILRQGEKNSHPVTECRRKINTKFPSGLCPLTVLFPCQPQQFCFSHSAFTWHLDEQYTASTKIPLLEFNHGCRGKGVICAGPGAELDHSDVIYRFNPGTASITHSTSYHIYAEHVLFHLGRIR